MNGEEDLKNYITYFFRPDKNKMELPVNDTLIVEFVVRYDGEVTDVNIIHKVNEEADESAINTIKQMVGWKPGKRKGKTVSVRYELPIVVNY